MNINNQLGLATHPIPVYNESLDQQLGFIGSDGQGMMFNANGSNRPSLGKILGIKAKNQRNFDRKTEPAFSRSKGSKKTMLADLQFSGGEYWASKAQPNYSDDNLIMLNEDSTFLNAGGDAKGNWRNDRRYYDGDESSVDFELDTLRIRDKSTGKIITNDLKYVQSKIEKYALESDDLRKRLEGTELDVTTTQYTTNSQKNQNRALANQKKWFSDRVVSRLKDILKDLEIAQEKALALKAKADSDAKIKADNDAFAKAKSSNTIVAYTEYLKNFPEGLSVDKANKAIDDIKKAEKIKALENQKINATPEEKKRIDSEIDAILGVASGTTGTVATRMFLYGGVALVGVYFLYKVLKGNSASA